MKYILSLDVGTTNIRSYIYTTEGKPIFAHSESVEIISKELGASEMDPGHIWDVTLSVTRRAVHWAKNENIKLECVGISLQRNTGTFWERKSGKILSNFITWQDVRCKDVVKEINTSYR
jgi:glycerol kinase